MLRTGVVLRGAVVMYVGLDVNAEEPSGSPAAGFTEGLIHYTDIRARLQRSSAEGDWIVGARTGCRH